MNWNALLQWCVSRASSPTHRARVLLRAFDSTADETFSTRRSLAQQGKHDEEDARDASRARQFTDEERRWFYEAMESGLVDEVSKMKEGTSRWRRRHSGGDATDDEDAIERALEDLIERVEAWITPGIYTRSVGWRRWWER